MDKAYICKINFFVKKDIEDLEVQYEIDRLIKSIAPKMLENETEYVSTQFLNLEECDNYGKCCNCGAWASDRRLKNFVKEFSNGAVINDDWYCDLCLPEDHENHF